MFTDKEKEELKTFFGRKMLQQVILVNTIRMYQKEYDDLQAEIKEKLDKITGVSKDENK